MLEVGDAVVDSERFKRLPDDARDAVEAGRAAEGLRLVSEALALWRGPPLANCPLDPAVLRPGGGGAGGGPPGSARGAIRRRARVRSSLGGDRRVGAQRRARPAQRAPARSADGRAVSIRSAVRGLGGIPIRASSDDRRARHRPVATASGARARHSRARPHPDHAAPATHGRPWGRRTGVLAARRVVVAVSAAIALAALATTALTRGGHHASAPSRPLATRSGELVLNPATGRTLRRVGLADLAIGPTATGFGATWIATVGGVEKVNSRTGRREGLTPLRDAHSVAVAGPAVWAMTTNILEPMIYAIEPNLPTTIERTFPVRGRPLGNVYSGAGRLWVTGLRFMTEIDPNHPTRVHHISVHPLQPADNANVMTFGADPHGWSTRTRRSRAGPDGSDCSTVSTRHMAESHGGSRSQHPRHP